MADDFGDIVPFKRKDNNKSQQDAVIPIKSYKAPNRINERPDINERLKLSNDLTPDDLIPNDLIRKNNKDIKAVKDIKVAKAACDITGEIVPYKKPAGAPGIPTEGGGLPPEGGVPPPEGGVPGAPACCDLSPITSILEELKNFLIGYSTTGTYFELRTETTVATLVQPITPDTVADASTGTVGYDFIDVNKQKQGQNAQKLWIINDGPPAPGVGDNLFVVTSSDGMTFSPEFLMIVGETRLVNNVYEVRIRSPRAGNIVRITEREAMVPYVTTVSNTLTPVANRSSFTGRRIGPLAVAQLLPGIIIPDSFSIVVRANVDNAGNGRVYVAGPDPLPGPSLANVVIAANRITLAPGDDVKYMVSNANLIAVVGLLGTEFVDITVEL